MEFIFPDVMMNRDSTWPSSSMLYWQDVDESQTAANFTSTLIIHVANEAADRDLRTVYIRPDRLDKSHLTHIHGTRPLDTANWDNIHFLHLTSEQNLIHWLSNVHLGKRFADLIILDGLEKYVKFLGPSDWSGVLRLTSLLEETRMYVHRVTRADEHGHDCRLIIGCGLPRSLPSLMDDLKPNRLPPHNLRGTYVINPQGSPQRFRLSSLENQWALEIENKHGEWFWSTLALARDQSRLSATEWSVKETISELGV